MCVPIMYVCKSEDNPHWFFPSIVWFLGIELRSSIDFLSKCLLPSEPSCLPLTFISLLLSVCGSGGACAMFCVWRSEDSFQGPVLIMRDSECLNSGHRFPVARVLPTEPLYQPTLLFYFLEKTQKATSNQFCLHILYI